MSSVELDSLWLNLAADPSVSMSFPYVETYQPALTVPGEERQGASGRIRAFSTGASSWTFGIDFSRLDDEHVAFLTAHAGELMWFRDHKGRKRAGRFRGLPFGEALYPYQYTTAQIAFTEVSLSEAV